jgi:L-Ala-D/L-Glu epimerase
VSSRETIVSVDAWPVDVPLTDPFVISRGRIAVAECAFVRVRLSGGEAGYGEIAPFSVLTGETRDASMEEARSLSSSLAGRRASDWGAIAADLASAAPHAPAARAGLECAVVDALARARGIPLHALWPECGGRPDLRVRETDVTLPILDDSRVQALADGWYARGFRSLKLKVGGADVEKDLARVDSLARRFGDVTFILDANQGYDRAAASYFVAQVGAAWPGRVLLIEQPLARDDLDGAAELCATSLVPIAADESVFTPADAERVVAAKAAHVVNLKIMKSGLVTTIEIARTVRSAGLGLMIGGMMETRLAMGVSLSLVLGFGGIDYLDLDTPLLMSHDPWVGGYRYDGPRLIPSAEPGLGMSPRPA